MEAGRSELAAWPPGLRGRDRERAALETLLAHARQSRGGALLLLGEPGTGRTSLLAAAAGIATAAGGTVLRTAGIRAEAAVPLAGLHRTLLPIAPLVRAVPGPHGAAPAEVLAGRVPAGGELALGAALSGLVAELGSAAPLLWCVDDAQWLDPATLRALGMAARRLTGLPAAMLFAADDTDPATAALEGLDTLRLEPLAPDAARRMLADRLARERRSGAAHFGAGPLPGTLPGTLRTGLTAESRLSGQDAAAVLDLAAGNPLALVELAEAAMDGRLPEPPALPAGSRLRERHRERFRTLGPGARTVVALVLSGGPLAAPVLAAAARRLGLAAGSVADARARGLVELRDGTATVPGRLLRTSLAALLSPADRLAAYAVLASVLDPSAARAFGALHRLGRSAAPSPETERELEAAAGAARRSTGHTAAATVLERGAEAAARPYIRGRWLVAAAADAQAAGETRWARGLLRRAGAQGGPSPGGAMGALVRGEIELRDGVPAVACRDLSAAIGRFPAAQRAPAVRALMLAGEAGCVAGDFVAYFDLADRARALRRSDDPPERRLVFDHFAGLAATFRGRHDQAQWALRRVVRLAETLQDAEPAVWAAQAAYTLGDARRAHALATAAVHRARRQGASALVPAALVYEALCALALDRYAAAGAAAEEGLRLAESTGQRNLAVDHLSVLALLAALQGDSATAGLRMAAAERAVAVRGLGRPEAFNRWVSACADLAADRPADALSRFARMRAGAGQVNLAVRGMAAPHFIEAAVRCGQRAKAAGALRAYEHWAAASRSSVRLALAHRCHGLLAEDDGTAVDHFREALRLHQDDDTVLELAKTELFYASRLRRTRRPGEARGLLRDAVAVFRQFDARPWTDRAVAELRAAGDRVGPVDREPGGVRELTAQQTRISELVAQGATNREIADLLLLSTRTVEYHLRNIFSRLGVRSRVELASLFR
ncbi:LuxR family transcriptional regulator [Streptomyces sp. NPDC026673]|uniref:helix-turn-helix transcriptional regulator n=1 Tax=Streptomyces sp. NPDC026673 TaxID=3155724 RepID=UPI0033E5F627